MIEDNSNTQAKKRTIEGRARASSRVNRLLKRGAKKLAEIPDEFLDRALRRLGEQLDAVKLMWDVNAKAMIEIPDEKIRQDAAIMILAYKWGKPVERNISASGALRTLQQCRTSSGARRLTWNTSPLYKRQWKVKKSLRHWSTLKRK